MGAVKVKWVTCATIINKKEFIKKIILLRLKTGMSGY